jgi:transcriptional regulator with XRE-family HTH domain
MHSVEEMNFGTFLNKKRLEKDLSLRAFASKIDLTASYLSDIEKGRRNPISNLDKLTKIALILQMTEEERVIFFDLAGKGYSGDNMISPDLPDYVMSEDLARVALRKAKRKSNDGDIDSVRQAWQELIDKLDN